MSKISNSKSKYYLVITVVVIAVVITLLVSSTSAPSSASTSKSAILAPKINIALLPSTFTTAAYQRDESGNYTKFYGFYSKYGKTPIGVNVITDLDKLNSIVSSNEHDHQGYLTAFHNRIKIILPDADVSQINDTYVHEGGIFLADGSNAFNMIILLHEEYVTQQMYDNFQHFVSNGGTLLFIDGNVFYAEVNYDKNKKSITLVKGHSWEFDGKTARRGVSERWFNETREWVGSNYWEKDVKRSIIFANNPFNYTHVEENYINNPADIIIQDYKANDPNSNVHSPTIATYELHYGKGKVIMVGLFAETLYKNENFLDFFDTLVVRGIQNQP